MSLTCFASSANIEIKPNNYFCLEFFTRQYVLHVRESQLLLHLIFHRTICATCKEREHKKERKNMVFYFTSLGPPLSMVCSIFASIRDLVFMISFYIVYTLITHLAEHKQDHHRWIIAPGSI